MTEEKQGRRAAPVVLAVALGVLAIVPRPGEAQRPEVRVFQDAPAALWISPPDVPGDAFGVFHFRRAFELSAPPDRFLVHVSADNRYRLYVNGRQVSSGPQRSDLMHWRYETLDLAPHLRAGRNVLAALVWNWGKERPVAQFSRRTAFLLQGDSGREAVVNTGPEWKVLAQHGLRTDPGARHSGLLRVSPRGGGGRPAHPVGLGGDRLQPTTAWTTAAGPEDWGGERAQPGDRGHRAKAGGWQLVPRAHPTRWREPEVRFATVRRAEGITPGDAFLNGAATWWCPPARTGLLLLDQTPPDQRLCRCSRRAGERAAASVSRTRRR